MRLPFPLRLNNRRGLLVYQLVLILIAIIILILVLLYVARRNQIGAADPAAARVPPHKLVAQYSGHAASLGRPRSTGYAEIRTPG